MDKCFFVILLSFSNIFASLNEKDVIIRALCNNYDIKSLNIRINQDSLNLESVNSEWIPKLSFSFVQSVNPIKNSSYFSSIKPSLSENSRLSSELNSSISQNLPGGGLLNIAFSNISDSIYKKIYNQFSVNLKQPLLRNAWKYGELSYNSKIARLSLNQSFLQKKKEIIALLSTIRTQFWNYYEQKIMADIHDEELARTEYLVKIESAKFTLGESAPLDTLSAQLEYLGAKQAVLDASISMKSAKNELSFSLDINPDSLSIIDSIDITISDLPEVDSIISMIEQYDPQLNIFDTLAKKVFLDQKKLKNTLLPSIDIDASFSHSRYTASNRARSSNAVISCILSYAIPDRSTKIKIKELNNSQLSNDLEKTKYQESTKFKIENLRDSWNQELQRIQLLQKTYELSKQKLLVAQKQYEIGTIEQIILLDAHKQYVQNQINLITSKIKMKKLEVLLDEITGTILDKFDLVSQF